MNIFALSNDPRESAVWQHDRHVVKMTLETAQLLSTAVWHDETIRSFWTAAHGEFRPNIDNVDSGSVRLYKSISNPGHCSAVWTRTTLPNFVWTWIHGFALVSEFHRRFQKLHACYAVFASFLPVVQAMTGVDSMWHKERSRPTPTTHLKITTLNPDVLAFAADHDPFAVAIQPQYRDACFVPGNPIESYLNFYRNVKIFQDHVKWTRCNSLPPLMPADFDSVDPRVAARWLQLVAAHESGIRAAAMPRDPHPDSLRPINPNNVVRFGVRAA